MYVRTEGGGPGLDEGVGRTEVTVGERDVTGRQSTSGPSVHVFAFYW